MNHAISGEILVQEVRFPRSEIFLATLHLPSIVYTVYCTESVHWSSAGQAATVQSVSIYSTRVAKNISLRGNLTSWTNISPEIA